MLETVILSNLINNEEYVRKVLPFLSDEYFSDYGQKFVFKATSAYVNKYNGLPSKEALRIAAENYPKFNEESYKNVVDLIDALGNEKQDLNWLVDETEKFCQDKAIYNAIKRSILILDGEDKKLDKGAIPELLMDALGVSFDTNIGHDYYDGHEERYEYYHRKENKVAFGIDMLDRITRGGVSKKSLSIFMAATGVGKSIVMCNLAANNYMHGLNVLYITAEMAEEEIGKRIDANLLDVPMDSLEQLPKEIYDRKISRIKSRNPGRLIIKEYPTSTVNANHIRHLLNELKLKKKFIPDIIYIDYLNICASSRIKMGGNTNSYTYIKSIAEEFRGLAVEFGIPIISATQSNREGYGNTDLDLTNTSESIGLPATVDFMAALMTNEELESTGQILIKQLKNRWGDLSTFKRFTIGIDRSRMKIFDLDNPTDGLSPDVHSNDTESTGNKLDKFEGLR